MTTLTIFADDNPSQPLQTLTQFEDIRQALSEIGVEFDRWEASAELPADATQEQVMEAYREAIQRLTDRFGFQSIDVVSMYPEHPGAEAARAKFLAEHTHDDFETRFFVDGEGAFYIRQNGKVYMTICTRGDLINLPANTTHWFDMGPKPFFKAIRFFRIPEGWVGRFTGDTIADRFPRFETAA